VWRPSPHSEHHARRGNCALCSSSLFWWAAEGERVAIGAGSLDHPGDLAVAAHIWTSQGSAWERPPADVPAYPRGYPPDGPALPWA
jgi:hypothetical protein